MTAFAASLHTRYLAPGGHSRRSPAGRNSGRPRKPQNDLVNKIIEEKGVEPEDEGMEMRVAASTAKLAAGATLQVSM
jgi:hypothetical protein